jgi:hypothetical protein
MITETTIPIIWCRNGYYLRWYYNGWHHWNFYSGTVGYLTAGEKYRTTGIRTVELSSGVVDSNEIAAIRSILNARECYMYTDGGWAECRVESGGVVVQRNRIDAYELTCKIRIGSRNVSATGYSVGETKTIIIIPPEPPIVSPDAQNNVYVGRFNSSGAGEIRLFGGIDRTIAVSMISTGRYSIYQYLGTTKFITLGVSEDGITRPTASIRSMNSINNNNHIVNISGGVSLANSNTRFFINWGNMENTRVAVGDFNSAGTTISQLYGDALTLGITRVSEGTYDITHDIGHTNYIIMGVGRGADPASLRSMDNIAPNSVRVRVSDDASLNDYDIRFIFIWENV